MVDGSKNEAAYGKALKPDEILGAGGAAQAPPPFLAIHNKLNEVGGLRTQRASQRGLTAGVLFTFAGSAVHNKLNDVGSVRLVHLEYTACLAAGLAAGLPFTFCVGVVLVWGSELLPQGRCGRHLPPVRSGERCPHVRAHLACSLAGLAPDHGCLGGWSVVCTSSSEEVTGGSVGRDGPAAHIRK